MTNSQKTTHTTLYLMYDSKPNTQKNPCQILKFKCLIRGKGIGVVLVHTVISEIQHV